MMVSHENSSNPQSAHLSKIWKDNYYIVFEPFLYLTNNFLDKLKGVEFSVQTEFRMDSDEVKIFKEYFCVTQRLIELFIENKEDEN